MFRDMLRELSPFTAMKKLSQDIHSDELSTFARLNNFLTKSSFSSDISGIPNLKALKLIPSMIL
jgi:hypothetical protein